MPFADSRLGPGTLKFDTTNEFNTQAAAVRLTPTVNSEDGTPTLAVPDPPPLSTIDWALNIDAIQDFTEPAGLVNYLMDNALSEVPFEWVPDTVDGTAYSGTVQIVPIEIGGDVAVQVVTSVELPMVGAPTRVDGVVGTTASSKREKAAA
jgi:hypothetical protein